MENREKALNWWNTQLSDSLRRYLVDEYYYMRTTESLTGREIEHIYNSELNSN